LHCGEKFGGGLVRKEAVEQRLNDAASLDGITDKPVVDVGAEAPAWILGVDPAQHPRAVRGRHRIDVRQLVGARNSASLCDLRVFVDHSAESAVEAPV
jgi:hypothetical protein